MPNTADGTKSAHGNADFPIHYQRGELRIYTNPAGEVFIENTKAGVTMRLNVHHDGLQFTAFGHHVDPTRVANAIGWRIHNRTPR